MGSRFRAAAVLLVGAVWCGRTPSDAQGPAMLEGRLEFAGAQESTPAISPDAKRLPIPPAEAVAAARDLIRQAYEEDYAQASKSSRRLIDKLNQTADGVEDDTRRYALLLEIEQVATDAGDVNAAIAASLRRGQCFDVDSATCRLEVLIAAARHDQRDDLALFGMFVDLADETLATGQIDVAEKAVAEALATTKRVERADRIAAAEERKRSGRTGPIAGKAPALLAEVTDRQRQLRERRKVLKEYELAVETLQQSPQDSRAHAIVGRYQCFIAEQWGDGLRSLLAGDSEVLRTVAGEELRMREEKQPKTEQLLAVAGSWWKVAEASGTAPTDAEAIKRHAAEMYRRALPDISDPIELALASKRVAAVKLNVDPPVAGANPTGRPLAVRRRGAPLRIPASTLLPAPAELSPELLPLLPTEAEVAALKNHVNVDDRQVRQAKNAYLQRVYAQFPAKAWTTADALYLIELNDSLNGLLGESSVVGPNWSMGGSRQACKAAMASMWLLAATSEQDFVRRMRTLPADAQGPDLERRIGERETKEWLLQLGPDYTATRRKLQAIQHLIDQGAASEGMRRYGEDLSRASTQP